MKKSRSSCQAWVNKWDHYPDEVRISQQMCSSSWFLQYCSYMCLLKETNFTKTCRFLMDWIYCCFNVQVWSLWLSSRDAVGRWEIVTQGLPSLQKVLFSKRHHKSYLDLKNGLGWWKYFLFGLNWDGTFWPWFSAFGGNLEQIITCPTPSLQWSMGVAASGPGVFSSYRESS